LGTCAFKEEISRSSNSIDFSLTEELFGSLISDSSPTDLFLCFLFVFAEVLSLWWEGGG